MENPRTTSARDHDDSEVIDQADDAPAFVSRSGGHLATDIGTQNELTQGVDDPDGLTRPMKQDDIANNVARPSDRRGNAE